MQIMLFQQNRNRNQNANNSEQKSSGKKPVVIATKTEKGEDDVDNKVCVLYPA